MRRKKQLLVLWSSCLHGEKGTVARFSEVGLVYLDCVNISDLCNDVLISLS